MREVDYVDVGEVVIAHKTNKAVKIEAGGDEMWIPLSVVDPEQREELEIGEVVDLRVADWFYRKNMCEETFQADHHDFTGRDG